jgi:phage shock protein C
MEKTNTHVKRLYRSTKNRMMFGVAGGLGEYFNIDPIIPRIVFLALLMGGGSGLLIYLVLAVLVPKEGSAVTKNAAPDVQGQAKELVSEFKEQGGLAGGKTVFGLAIILIGIVLLVGSFFPRHFSIDIFWAVITIAVGVFIFTESEKSKFSEKKEEKPTEKK